MTDAPRPFAPHKVPTSRAARALHLGGLSAGILGRAALDGVSGALRGQRVLAKDLLLSPANARQITAHLSRMRGAAMKVGQLLSMEATDLLSPEVAALLAPLRDQAHVMPPHQLKRLLSAAWGPDFPRQFKRFDVQPLAAASIGQVHRAQTHAGRDLAIKVQYPGVAAAIDSDIANLGLLLRLPGLGLGALDLAPLLEAARVQLHAEADYLREGAMLARFGAALGGDYLVPGVDVARTSGQILAMDFVAGVPLEQLSHSDQTSRDAAATALVRLCLQELFDLGLMQTDPNMANFLWDPESGRLGLLDFGAAQEFAPAFVADHRALLQAALAQDGAAARPLLRKIGYFGTKTPPDLEDRLLASFVRATAPLRGGVHDFDRCTLLEELRAEGFDLASERSEAPLPPAPALFLQRKIAGTYLLAKRLRARVDLGALLRPFLDAPPR